MTTPSSRGLRVRCNAVVEQAARLRRAERVYVVCVGCIRALSGGAVCPAFRFMHSYEIRSDYGSAIQRGGREVEETQSDAGDR